MKKALVALLLSTILSGPITLSAESPAAGPYVRLVILVDPDVGKQGFWEKIVDLAKVDKYSYIVCRVESTNYYHESILWWVSPSEYRIQSSAQLGSPRIESNYADFVSRIPIPQASEKNEFMYTSHRLLNINGRLLVYVSLDKKFLEERSKKELGRTQNQPRELRCKSVTTQ